MRNQRLRVHVPLTAEERRAANFEVEGYPVTAIAIILGTTETTVRRWLSNVRHKFGTTQLLAIQLKLAGELPEHE